MDIRQDTLKAYLETEDPIHWVWEEVCKIYNPDSYPEDISRFYEEREQALNVFERFLYETFFETYDLILEQSLKHRNLKVQELFGDSSFVLIADALSFREALLFKEYLRLDGSVEILDISFWVSPFPPLTETLSQILLKTASPAQGSDTQDFRYRYVAGSEAIPDLPYSGKLLVWLRLPDKILEEITLAQTHTIKDAFEKSRDAILEILRRSKRSEAIITSDHGYLYAIKPEHYWPLPKGMGKIKSYFGRSARGEKDRDKVEKIDAFEAAEAYRRRFAIKEGYAALRGRFWWGTSSPNDRCAVHGGLSILDVLIPIIKVRSLKDGL